MEENRYENRKLLFRVSEKRAAYKKKMYNNNKKTKKRKKLISEIEIRKMNNFMLNRTEKYH